MVFPQGEHFEALSRIEAMASDSGGGLDKGLGDRVDGLAATCIS